MARIHNRVLFPWALVALLAIREVVALSTQSGAAASSIQNSSSADMAAAHTPLAAPAASPQISPSPPFAWTEAEAREKLAGILRKELEHGAPEMPVDLYYQYATYLTESERARLQEALSALVPAPKLSLFVNYFAEERRLSEAQARAAMVEVLGAERAQEVISRSRFDDDIRIGKEARLNGAVLQEELGLSPEQRQGLEQIIVEQSQGARSRGQEQPVPYEAQREHEQRLFEQVRKLLNPGQLERYKDLIKKSDYMRFDPSVSLPQPPFEDEDDDKALEVGSDANPKDGPQ